MRSLPVSHPIQKLSDTPKAYNKYSVSIIKVQSETNTPASVVAKGREEADHHLYIYGHMVVRPVRNPYAVTHPWQVILKC